MGDYAIVRMEDEYHFEPEGYAERIREEVWGYDELHEELLRATEGLEVARALELGTGSGETARRVLELQPQARLVGIDVSAEMLAEARGALPAERVETLIAQRLQDPLPAGPFGLVFSSLAVHHLDSEEKADLFRRVAEVLASGGRFVLADAVVPERPEEAEVDLTEGYDKPDTVADQLEWLRDAGFDARVTWARKDLAVLVAEL